MMTARMPRRGTRVTRSVKVDESDGMVSGVNVSSV